MTLESKEFNNNSIFVEPTPPGRKPVKPKKTGNLLQTLSIFFIALALIILLATAGLLFSPSIESWIPDQYKSNFIRLRSELNPTGQDSSQSNNDNNQSFSFAGDQGSKPISQVVDEVLPSILSIRVRNQSGLQGLSGESAGTGYFVSDDGLVVTNRHVISSACRAGAFVGATITGLASNQKAYQLEIMTIDPIDDVAILRVKNPGNERFQPVKFADSTKLRLGGEVIAIGNVLGELSNTVTQGIVSGLDRSLATNQTDPCTNRVINADGLVQTDAAINRGNSGGPLFDASGNVVGMNTFGAQQAQNIGFAIPSSVIVSNLNIYKETGKITRPFLGVATIAIDPARKVENDWLPTDYGELIYSPQGSPVSVNSAAEKAGLKNGDVILEVNGKKLLSGSNNTSPLRREILNKQPNQEIELTVIKSIPNNGSEVFRYLTNTEKVKVTLGSVSFDLNNQPNLR